MARLRPKIDIDIEDGMQTWDFSVGNANLPVFYLYYYYPKYVGCVENYQERIRHLIWDFKDGSNTPFVCKQVVTVLKHFFLEETLSSLTFVCIPASTERANKIRYESFSSKVTNACDMWNGFDYIGLKYDRKSKHMGGGNDFNNIVLDSQWFRGKKVIIFDDVVTHGDSINDMKCRLERIGARVIGAITLGYTVHSDYGMDPYTQMDKSAKSARLENCIPQIRISNSAKESTRLYQIYGDVSVVAGLRGLAESTVYGHVFSTGALDPGDYISAYNYKKACRIYESGCAFPSLELDKFLDVVGKAAFYFIRRCNKI